MLVSVSRTDTFQRQQQQRVLLDSYCRPRIHQKSSGVLTASCGGWGVSCNTGVWYKLGNVVLFLLSCWIHVHHVVALSIADSLEAERLYWLPPLLRQTFGWCYQHSSLPPSLEVLYVQRSAAQTQRPSWILIPQAPQPSLNWSPEICWWINKQDIAPLTPPGDVAAGSLMVWWWGFLSPYAFLIAIRTSVWMPLLHQHSSKDRSLGISASKMSPGLHASFHMEKTGGNPVHKKWVWDASRSGAEMFAFPTQWPVHSPHCILTLSLIPKDPLQQDFPPLTETLASAVVCCLEKAWSRREGRSCSEESVFSEKASEAKRIKSEWVLSL